MTDEQMREKGTVKTWFAERGFGFVRRRGCPDVFLHVSNLRDQAQRDDVAPGRAVEFEVQLGHRGMAAFDAVLL